MIQIAKPIHESEGMTIVGDSQEKEMKCCRIMNDGEKLYKNISCASRGAKSSHDLHRTNPRSVRMALSLAPG